MRREYQGAAQSARLTTSLGGTLVDLTIYCDDLSNWPTGVAGRPFYVVIDRDTASEEKILCASRSGNVISVYNVGGNNGRGADGTSITAHGNNATIEHVFTATDADEANAMVNTLTTKGDLLTRSSSALVRVPVGTDGQTVYADSTQTPGVRWGDPTPYAICAARLSATGLGIAPSDSAYLLGTINWPVGRFSQIPVVSITLNGSNTLPGSYRPIFNTNTTTTNTIILFANANISATMNNLAVDVLAVQMTPGSATG